MQPRTLIVACAVAAACSIEPSGSDLSEAEFRGWDAPEVVRAEAADGSAAKAVGESPDPAPIAALAATVEKAPLEVAFARGGRAATSPGLDLGSALAGAAVRVPTTASRTMTQRSAAPAPKGPSPQRRAAPVAPRSRPRAGGTASLSLDGPSLERGLSSDEIKQVAVASMGQVRACYERALKADPSLRGRVVVDWTIGASGRVTAASIQADDLGDEPLQHCLLDTVRDWRFPEAERATDVTFPFTLKPG